MAFLNNPYLDDPMKRSALQATLMRGTGVAGQDPQMDQPKEPLGPVKIPAQETSATPTFKAPQAPTPSMMTSDVSRGNTPETPIQIKAPQPTPEMQGRESEFNRLNKTGPYSQQVHNPWAKAGLIAANVAGALFPRLAEQIPGTDLHHNMLVRNSLTLRKSDQDVLNDEAKRQQETAQAANLESEIPLHGAQTRHADAQAEALLHPDRKPERITNEFQKWLVDNPNATLEDWEKFKADHAKASPVATPFEKWMRDNPQGTVEDWFNLQRENKPEKEPNKDDRFIAIQQKKAAGQALTPDEIAYDKAYRTYTDVAKTQPGVVRVEAGANATTDRQNRMEAYKSYEPALESAERFNIMAKNYEDAVRNHDQQAMLSLLANHLGMTMGLQKGSRLTKDIISEAIQSRPWLQGLAAKFDQNGVLSGVTLTPEQMRQMVVLGRERFAEDLTKANSQSRFINPGDKSGGPERQPNKSTINFYLGLANGDLAKAKQLAATDGWSVK